ncbi:amino acid permease, partial [Escherichia coli]
MAGNVQEKQLRWYNIALMSFITVWGFGNVVNNYANQGLVVVFSWVFIFALYFTPYALIVGQLGSTFKDGKGGVSTWIKHTMGPGLAYLAAWTYWVVHIPYLAQKPQAILIALGWAMKGDGSLIKEYSVVALQGLTLVLFIFFMWVASRGMKSLKIVGSVAGIAMFVMSLLYVAMAVTAPAITEVHIATTNITWETFIPHIDFTYITTISMLVFAVGGAEKISPYVNQT